MRYDVALTAERLAASVLRQCPPPRLKTSRGGSSGGLLALGDSFSSGEGAGDYEHGTDTKLNRCHRSRNAWPVLVANQRKLEVLPSVACSGALVTHVIAGDPAARRNERNQSQIDRISGDPAIITISIGGNDLGFSKVLFDCVRGNCITRYDRPSGDVIDARIGALAERLPGVYRLIQRAAPRARVVVVSYPKLFPKSDPGRPAPNCAAKPLGLASRITPAEGNYLNRKIELANAAILTAAKRAGVESIDLSEALDGGALTCTEPRYVNNVVLRSKLRRAWVHPNALGQERMATVVAKGLTHDRNR